MDNMPWQYRALRSIARDTDTDKFVKNYRYRYRRIFLTQLLMTRYAATNYRHAGVDFRVLINIEASNTVDILSQILKKHPCGRHYF